MAFIYYAGPVDFALADGTDVLAPVRKRLTEQNHVIYNATTVFEAGRVDYMNESTMKSVIDIHHAAIRECDAVLADLRGQSVGIPIEIMAAFQERRPVFVLVSERTKHSLYIRYIAIHSLGAMSEDPNELSDHLFDCVGFNDESPHPKENSY